MPDDSVISAGTVLVTGAARRIGRELALGLAEAGWNIAVHYNHSADEANEVVEAARGKGVEAAAFQADLHAESDMQRLVGAVTAGLGPLRCLINNASTFEYDRIESASRESWDLHMEVNLRAPFVLSQHFADQLPPGESGNIINIVDQRVWRLTPEFMTYTISKAALWTLTQTMAQALAPEIRVNAIGPGPVLPSKRQTAENFSAQVEALPLQTHADPSEICRAVRFILETGSMTGQMIALDGGQHLSWRTPDIAGQPE